MKLARDTWLTFQYETGQQVHSPLAVAATLLNPVTYLLFFTPFLKSVLHAPSYGDAFQIYVPLLFCSMGLFGGLFAGFALVAAIREGVITRLQVTPLSRVGLLLGRELMLVALIGFQAVVITVIALIFGLRVPPANFLLALIVLAMMVLLGVSISYAMALFVPEEGAGEPDQRGGPAALAAGRGADPAVGRTAVGAARRPVEPMGLGGQRHAGDLRGPHRRPGRLAGEPHPGRCWPWWPWCCRHGCSPARSHDRTSRLATARSARDMAIAWTSLPF